jgi:hypothetical protein
VDACLQVPGIHSVDASVRRAIYVNAALVYAGLSGRVYAISLCSIVLVLAFLRIGISAERRDYSV